MMTAQQVSNHRKHRLLQGSSHDPRLLHSDPADNVMFYPSCTAQGYRQEIQLRDDLTLAIVNYELKHDVLLNANGQGTYTKFEFPVIKASAQYSNFIPSAGFNRIFSGCAGKRVFEVEVIFKQSAMASYLQAYIERMPVRMQQIVGSVLAFLRKFQGIPRSWSSTDFLSKLNTGVTQGEKSPFNGFGWEHLLPSELYSETLDLHYASRAKMTPSMEKLIGQILACPYRGGVRRTYLERKATELVELRLQAIAQPQLNPDDLQYIYQAASILRNHLANPPTVEELARQTSTNRLKLNRGFHQVYNTTPYGYLRDARLNQARQLLVTSDLAIEAVAATVGYRSRNHFAKTFRRQIGVNPKVFQKKMR